MTCSKKRRCLFETTPFVITLINYLKSIVDFKTYSYINLETDADANENAIRFYEKNGFVKERMYVTPEGRSMIEFQYRGQAK